MTLLKGILTQSVICMTGTGPGVLGCHLHQRMAKPAVWEWPTTLNLLVYCMQYTNMWYESTIMHVFCLVGNIVFR